MKTLTIKFLLLCSLFLSQNPLMSERKDYTREEYNLMSRCVNEIENTLRKEMYKQFGLECSGGGGSMPYDIQSRRVNFQLFKQVTIEEARELLVKATEAFIKLINAHEAVRPYLRDYPWNHDRAEIMLSFSKNNGKDYPEGIRLTFIAKGNILYYGPEKSPNEIGGIIKREPYEEAKQIVNSSPSCLTNLKKKKRWFGLF